mgnify:FL=1
MNRNHLSFLIIISSLSILIKCSAGEQNEYEGKNKVLGKQLFSSNCETCHNLPANSSTGIAPSVLSIKQAYKASSLEEFQESLIQFLNSPSKETSKMKNAVDQYGLMPKMGFSESDLISISEFLYNSDLEHLNSSQESVMEFEQSDLEKGKSLALQTKSILGKNLMQAVKNHGADGAIEFCNEKAIVLTDSMGTKLHSSVKRVTDKPRNANNMANKNELEILKSLQLEQNKHGIIKTIEGKKIGYYKIETNDMCMKCHGDINTEIDSKTANRISELYPKDKATGYKPNELRGMWAVEIPSK